MSILDVDACQTHELSAFRSKPKRQQLWSLCPTLFKQPNPSNSELNLSYPSPQEKKRGNFHNFSKLSSSSELCRNQTPGGHLLTGEAVPQMTPRLSQP